jgi:hypothetical protein
MQRVITVPSVFNSFAKIKISSHAMIQKNFLAGTVCQTVFLEDF